MLELNVDNLKMLRKILTTLIGEFWVCMCMYEAHRDECTQLQRDLDYDELWTFNQEYRKLIKN